MACLVLYVWLNLLLDFWFFKNLIKLCSFYQFYGKPRKTSKVFHLDLFIAPNRLPRNIFTANFKSSLGKHYFFVLVLFKNVWKANCILVFMSSKRSSSSIWTFTKVPLLVTSRSQETSFWNYKDLLKVSKMLRHLPKNSTNLPFVYESSNLY